MIISIWVTKKLLYKCHFQSLGYFLKDSWTLNDRFLVFIWVIQVIRTFRKEKCFFFVLLKLLWRHEWTKHSNPVLLFFLLSKFWQNIRIDFYDTKGRWEVSHAIKSHNFYFLTTNAGLGAEDPGTITWIEKEKKANFSPSQQISIYDCSSISTSSLSFQTI